jgi:hypothetical protein
MTPPLTVTPPSGRTGMAPGPALCVGPGAPRSCRAVAAEHTGTAWTCGIPDPLQKPPQAGGAAGHLPGRPAARVQSGLTGWTRSAGGEAA